MSSFQYVVVGASSGGTVALQRMLHELPSGLDAAVLVVIHLSSDSANYFPKLLSAETSLPVQIGQQHQSIQPGSIYVAPADYHMLVETDAIALHKGPRENRVRPAIDPLFRSAALAHGKRVTGVVLSGYLDDGTSGLEAVKQCGGTAIVQDPQEALVPDMPQSALEYVDIDYSLPAGEIGRLLGQITSGGTAEVEDDTDVNSCPESLKKEVEIIRRESGRINSAMELGELAPASCPECGGPMWEMEGELSRFRCHTGHAFTARHLVAGLKEKEETSLWAALRVMEERLRSLRRMAQQDREKGRTQLAQVYDEKAAEAAEHVSNLRNLLHSAP